MALADFLPQLDALTAAGVADAAVARAQLADLIDRGLALAAAVDAAERGRVQLISWSRASVLALAGDLNAFVDAYYVEEAYPPDLFLNVRLAALGCYQLVAYRRGFADTPSMTASQTSDAVAPQLDGRPLIPYIVRAGDTVERLANDYLGDVNRSWEILELNDLTYPFLITNDEDARVVAPTPPPPIPGPPGFGGGGFGEGGFPDA